MGDKIPADKKSAIESALAKLKEAHKAQDIAGIDAASTELNNVLQACRPRLVQCSGSTTSCRSTTSSTGSRCFTKRK